MFPPLSSALGLGLVKKWSRMNGVNGVRVGLAFLPHCGLWACPHPSSEGKHLLALCEPQGQAVVWLSPPLEHWRHLASTLPCTGLLCECACARERVCAKEGLCTGECGG